MVTYGRALWAIDDISPLRELAAKASEVASSNAYLFAPQAAVRMVGHVHGYAVDPNTQQRRNCDRAILDYYLKSATATEIELEIYDGAGKLVRRCRGGAKALEYKVNVPGVQLAPPQLLSTKAGLNPLRVGSALSGSRPASLHLLRHPLQIFEYISAVGTASGKQPWHKRQGPMVLPGRCEVRLTVGGQTLRRPTTVKLDPRLTYSTQSETAQLSLAQKIAAGMKATYAGYGQVTQLHDQLACIAEEWGQMAERVDGGAALDAKTEGLDGCRNRADEPRYSRDC